MLVFLFLGRLEGMLVGLYSFILNYLIFLVFRCLWWMMLYIYKNNLLWIIIIMVFIFFYNFLKEIKLFLCDFRMEFYDKKFVWIDGMNISVIIYVRYILKCVYYIIKIIMYSICIYIDVYIVISKYVWMWSMGESSWKVYNLCV